MNEATQSTDYLKKTKDSLDRLRDKLNLSDVEKFQLGEKKLHELDEIIEKVENGVVEIAVFGEVSSGKSALLNALLGYNAFEVGARNGVTIIQDRREWESLSSKITTDGYKNSKVILVDSPGINEVDGAERTKIAYNTILTSDVILFIVKGDLTETEYSALKDLHYSNKPIIVAINKIDVLTKKERKEIFDSIKTKLEGYVNPKNIVETAGEPRPVTVIIQKSDGSEEVQERNVEPLINDLRKKIIDILPEWQKIIAVNSALFAANLDNEATAIKIAHRKKLADFQVYKYSVLKGAVTGINPVPLLDLVASVPIDYLMVNNIASVYSTNFSFKDSQELIREISYSNFLKVGGAELATFFVSTVAKGLSLGISQVAFAIPQAIVGAWTSWIIGKSTDVYFSQGASWGIGGAKTVVKEIIDNSDKESIISELKIGIIEMLNNKDMINKELKKAREAAKKANDEEGLSWLNSIRNNAEFLGGFFKNNVKF